MTDERASIGNLDGDGNWSVVTSPRDGIVTGLQVDGECWAIQYADGAVWKTEDDGKTWREVIE